MMNQVHVVLLWAENLDKMKFSCVVLNGEPDYFFGKLCNHNQCKKTRSTFCCEWCVDAVLNSSIG